MLIIGDEIERYYYIPYVEWKVLTEIDRTIGDGAANDVGDSHRQIEPVDETDVVPIQSIGSIECPFRY